MDIVEGCATPMTPLQASDGLVGRTRM